jgi:hypothetical protein
VSQRSKAPRGVAGELDIVHLNRGGGEIVSAHKDKLRAAALKYLCIVERPDATRRNDPVNTLSQQHINIAGSLSWVPVGIAENDFVSVGGRDILNAAR